MKVILNLILNRLGNYELKSVNNYNINDCLETFIKESGSKFTFMEGFGDNSLRYLQLNDPSDIPTDILVAAFIKDGEYNQQELSRPFTIWNRMERNYVKLFQSKNYMGEDGSTRFFCVFKKRMLIQKNREIIDLELQNTLFDEKIFRNYF